MNSQIALTQTIIDALTTITSTAMTDQGFPEKYIGVVVDNQDPTYRGRVKINVLGVFDKISDISYLPWAVPIEESILGNSLIIPEMNSLVHVYFKNGDIYQPHYTTKVSTKLAFENTTLSDFLSIDRTNYDNQILFANDNSSLQFNRLTSEIIFKNKDKTTVVLSGDSVGTDNAIGSTNINSISIGVGDNSVFNISIDPTLGITVSDGTGDNIISIQPDGTLINNKTELTVGTDSNRITFDEITKMQYNCPGVAVPDMSRMGPYNALPVDPMTGLAHSGHILVTNSEPNQSYTPSIDHLNRR